MPCLIELTSPLPALNRAVWGFPWSMSPPLRGHQSANLFRSASVARRSCCPLQFIKDSLRTAFSNFLRRGLTAKHAPYGRFECGVMTSDHRTFCKPWFSLASVLTFVLAPLRGCWTTRARVFKYTFAETRTGGQVLYTHGPRCHPAGALLHGALYTPKVRAAVKLVGVMCPPHNVGVT